MSFGIGAFFQALVQVFVAIGPVGDRRVTGRQRQAGGREEAGEAAVGIELTGGRRDLTSRLTAPGGRQAPSLMRPR
jgi:hypothetical protein